MDEILNQITSIIPPKYAALLTTLFVASQVLGRILQAIRTGGGLKSILASVWLGTNAPKPNGETSNVQPAESDVPPFRPPVWIIGALLAVTLGTAGCKTPRLEPGGAYSPTNSVGQVIYKDVGLAVADASYKFTYESALAVFRFERENRAEIWKLAPGVKRSLDKLRPNVVEVNRRWAIARQAYKVNPTPAGLTTLQTILAELQRLLPVVQAELVPVTSALTKTSSLLTPNL